MYIAPLAPTAIANTVPSMATCTHCAAPPTPSNGLKSCGACLSARYCNRACQVANWKSHKQTCTGRTGDPVLRSLTETEVFGLLVDTYRLRVEDTYLIMGEVSGLYAGEDPLPEFVKFLGNAEGAEAGKLLPSWWTPKKRGFCVRFGMREDHWWCLNSAVEQSDIVQYYGDPTICIKLRLLAKKIHGKPVGD